MLLTGLSSVLLCSDLPGPLITMLRLLRYSNLQEFRHRVRSSLGKAGVASPFSRDALEDAGARHGPPFAVVCSGQMDLEVGRWAFCPDMLLALAVTLAGAPVAARRLGLPHAARTAGLAAGLS